MNFPEKKILVSLFSDPNFLAVNILESLLSKNCSVNVVSKDIDGWQELTSHIVNKSHFSLLDFKSAKQDFVGYSIIVSGFLKGNPYGEINEIFRRFDLRQAKNLILIPFEKFSHDLHFRLSDNTAIIYLGDVLGPRMDLSSDLLAAHLVNEILRKRKTNFGVGELIYPVFVSDAARLITKWLFSFGPYGKETLILGPRTSATSFWQVNQSVVGELKLHYDKSLPVRNIPRGIEVKEVPCDLGFTLVEMYRWFSRAGIDQGRNPKSGQLFIARRMVRHHYPKFLKPLTLSLGFLLALPFALILLSALLFFISYRQFVVGMNQGAINFLYVAKTLLVISKGESRLLSFTPIVGRVYEETSFIAEVGERFSDIGVTAIPVVKEASLLADRMFGNEVYDVGVPSQKISSGLALLYDDLSLLAADTREATSQKLWSASVLEDKIDLEKIKDLALQGKFITENLADLAGATGTKSYLILFQNNMELRPTGGFIGSFGILTFDKGRITDLAVNDVYSADGQLNGHVEPPAPIKNYLGEANWWFRDSNWDPDFPTSAKRAEWFLDKEMGKSVDGVIAIDLKPIKDLLGLTGPVFLSDFNLDITTDNLYQKTQEEVQENFFPGTHRKVSFLTALSRNLLAQFSKLTTRQKIGMFMNFYSNLEGRHIQVFLHDRVAQDAIGNLNWAGGVGVPNCGNDCFGDLVGLVEANVGINKVNYFIKRSEDLRITLSPGLIERKLTLTLENSANPQLGLSGKYKVYIRLLTPQNSQIQYIRVVTGDVAENLTPEIIDLKGRRETGVLVEVFGGQTKSVEFDWVNKIPGPAPQAKYGLYVRKQAGTGDDNLDLTINGKKIYNKPLATDYFDRLSF